jgi:hypothetical protein
MRYQWATRDRDNDDWRGLWADRPEKFFPTGMSLDFYWVNTEASCGMPQRRATVGEIIRRFGCDLRRGEIRRIPKKGQDATKRTHVPAAASTRAAEKGASHGR